MAMGWNQVAIIAVAAAVLGLSLAASQPEGAAGQAVTSFFSGFTWVEKIDNVAVLESLERYPLKSPTPGNDDIVIGVVEETIREYDMDPEGTLQRITAMQADLTDPYPFVVDPDTMLDVAHGAFPHWVGTVSVLFSVDSDKSHGVLITELNNLSEVGTWVEYLLLEKQFESDQIKRSYVVLHDGLIFGAGMFYPAEDRVRFEVDRAIFLYNIHGEDMFDYVNSKAAIPHPYYTSIVNIKSAKVVAHGAFPGEIVGTKVTTSREGLSDLDQKDAFWLYAQNKNPMTGLIDQKRIWMVPHDGYFFSSGYYYHAEEKTRFVVEKVVDIYNTEGKDAAFGYVSSLESKLPEYPFVVDPDTGNIVAHGAFPDKIGSSSVIMTDRTERPTVEILADLGGNGSTWTDYKFQNPRTDQLEHKRSYLQINDGYIFGSGFYYSIFGSSE